MARARLSDLLRHVRRTGSHAENGVSEDRQLLDRFLARRDEAAFEALVRRHGPMVLGVCRRVLGDAHDSEDAFQATFLVLLRKAASLRQRDRLANWLYGVAYRTALKARVGAARRRTHEKRAAERPDEAPEGEVLWRDLRPVLDEELQRLPARYRLPVVLCCLQDHTLQEAARQLGWPAGTVSGRLARARDLLRKRLTRRGVTLTAGLLVVGLSEKASAAVPAPLLSATVRGGLIVTSGRTALGTLSPSVVALTRGVLQAMFLTQLRVALGCAGVVLGVAVGAGVFAYSEPSGAPDEPDAPTAVRQPQETEPPDRPPLAAFSEDKVKALLAASPAGEKLKSLLNERFEAAKQEMHARRQTHLAGRGSLDVVLGASLRLLEAERELSDQKANQLAALENHLERTREFERLNQARFDAGRIAIEDLAQSRFYRAQAEIWLERAKAK